MTQTLSETRLLGRDAEIARLELLVAALPEQGGALVVRGQAGIGKSALLEVAQRSATGRGFAVLTTSGVQSEGHLAFAGLHQLLLPVLGGLGRLPVRQREAVEAAFGMSDSAAPDTFLIGLGTLDLLAEEAAATPLVLVVEDAHWLDTATCDVLTFVARRVELEPIVLVFAVRDGFDARIEAASLSELRLDGLADGDAGSLLDETAPGLVPALRARILSEAEGNPLALVELPRALADDAPIPLGPQAPLPLTERLERAFAARASELPPDVRRLLLVAALDQGGELSRVLEAATILAGRPVAVGELAAAAQSGLVAADERGVRFRHPLIRSAIYQDASLEERHETHAALAAAYAPDPDRSVWHRAASLVAPDDAVVADLEQAAARASRRGAPAGAAAALERAAGLTADGARRASLLLQAAELEHEIGRHDVAVRILREARLLDADRATAARISLVLEALESGWSGADRVPAFVDIAEELQAEGETARAVGALVAVGMRCWWGNPEQETRDRVVAVAERLPLPPDDPALLSVLALADPVGRGALVLERLAAPPAANPADPISMFALGSAAASVWAQNLALPLLAAAADGFRAQGRVTLLAQALVSQAWAAVHVADARVATLAAAEGAGLCEETGQPRWAASAVLARATMAAERGHADEAERLSADAERVLLPMGANPMLSLVQFARGRAAIAQARFAEAYEQLWRIFDPADIAHQPFVGAWAIADFVDAAAHGGGDLAVARRTLAAYAEIAERTRAPLLRAQVGYLRPLLAAQGEEPEAQTLFQNALEDTELAGWRCYRGRLLLAYGAWLRRQRRAAESRAPLRAAAEAFDALGFTGMAERARQELRASGETSRARAVEAWNELSPQELQIARMAADGMTNRQIGERLYLSHRTIGSHLYRIFPKLGITSRSQLRATLEGVAQGG